MEEETLAGYNVPIYTNHFISGTTIVIDRAGNLDMAFIDITLSRSVLTFFSRAQTSISSYMRLSGVSTISNLSIAILKIDDNHATGAVGPWTSAEAKHAGISIFNTDPDNNYILMISSAATTAGERDIQLVKQVAGVETILDTEVCGCIVTGTEYILTLQRNGSNLVEGKVYSLDGTLLATVSATDTSLSSGNTGTHAYATTYLVRGIKVQ